MTEDLGEPGAEFAIVASDCGLGEFTLKIRDESGGVAELDGADALVGSGEEDLAEITLANRVADGESFAAVAIGEGSHAQLGRGSLVNAAGRRVSGSVQGVCHIRAFLQLMLEGFDAQRVGVFAGSDTEEFLEATQ